MATYISKRAMIRLAVIWGGLLLIMSIVSYFQHPHHLLAHHASAAVVATHAATQQPQWQHLLFTFGPSILIGLILVWQLLRGAITLSRFAIMIGVIAVLLLVPTLHHHYY